MFSNVACLLLECYYQTTLVRINILSRYLYITKIVVVRMPEGLLNLVGKHIQAARLKTTTNFDDTLMCINIFFHMLC